MVRVVVADDHSLVRVGIQAMLEAETDLTVVGWAADGEAAVRVTAEQQPDVVVMDMRMPGLDGAEATRRLTQEGESTDRLVKVLILTTFDDRETLYGALLSGASGFLLKDNAPAWLVDAVRAVAAGNAWLDPTTGAHVIEALTSAPRLGLTGSDRLAHLTAREREVLVLVASGLTNAEICDRLVLSVATVRTHVARILMKTGCRDRSQAVALAYQSRLVRVDGRPGA
jgi:DNA-binding NarL/FixJ family response regulator